MSLIRLFDVNTTTHKSICRDYGYQIVLVDLNPTQDVHLLQFRNYYTHSLAIFFKKFETQSWALAVNEFQLMSSHCEENGQKWFTLSKEQFCCDLDNVSQIKLILRQPSVHWDKFGIEHLSLYRHGDKPNIFSCTSANPSQYISSKVQAMCKFDVYSRQEESVPLLHVTMLPNSD